jgi:hypothetical protein
MFPSGAATFTQEPWFESLYFVSALVVPATPITPGVAEGYVTQLQFEFPAAAVRTTPSARA